MIRVMCPHCERTFRTRVEGMGKTAICTGCGETFRIGDARPPFEWQPSQLGEDSWIGVPPPEAEKEFKHCIICDAPLNEGDITCAECGANQVTGVVHSRRHRDPEAKRESTWTLIPLRPLLVMLVIAAVAGGLLWLMLTVARVAEKTTEQLAEDLQVGQAAAMLRAGATEYDIREEFANQVTDENLVGIAYKALNARRDDFQQAATWMVAAGDFQNIAPLLEADGAENTQELRRVLREIGPHRLIELSNQDNPTPRLAAARALCILYQLPEDEHLEALAKPSSPAEKVDTLNDQFRYWPRATGTFAVTVAGQEAPFRAMVEQIGSIFYLTIGTRRFDSVSDLPRTFEIPIEQWCAATGTAIDEKALRNLMTGQVTLTSPFGVGWEGTVRLTTKQAIPDGPPGFLPVGTLKYGQRIEAPIVLE